MKLYLKKKLSAFHICLYSSFIFLFLFLNGCGTDEELVAFQANILEFHDNISALSDSMNTIDPSSPDAVTLVNDHLSSLQTEFETLSELEVPSEFSNIETIADDAVYFIQEAARLYRDAYEDDYVNESFIQAAVENYESAIKRIEYIAILLQGKIPEGAVLLTEDKNEVE